MREQVTHEELPQKKPDSEFKKKKKELEAKISYRHRQFALAYIQTGGNGAQAARAAGYSHREAPRTASRILATNPDVMRYVTLLESQTTDIALETVSLSKEYVALKLMHILEKGSRDSEVRASAGVSAAAVLCKMNGYEAPVKNINIQANIESLDQLAAILNPYESDY